MMCSTLLSSRFACIVLLFSLFAWSPSPSCATAVAYPTPLPSTLTTLDELLEWSENDNAVSLLLLYDDRHQSFPSLSSTWANITATLSPTLANIATVDRTSALGAFVESTFSTTTIPSIRLFPAERAPRRNVPVLLNAVTGLFKTPIEYTGPRNVSSLRSAIVASYTAKHITVLSGLIALPGYFREFYETMGTSQGKHSRVSHVLVLFTPKRTTTDLYRVVSTRIRNTVRAVQVILGDSGEQESGKSKKEAKKNSTKAASNLREQEDAILAEVGHTAFPALRLFDASQENLRRLFHAEDASSSTKGALDAVRSLLGIVPGAAFPSSEKVSIETLLAFVAQHTVATIGGNQETQPIVLHFERTRREVRERTLSPYLSMVAQHHDVGALQLVNTSMFHQHVIEQPMDDIVGLAFLDPNTDEYQDHRRTLRALLLEGYRTWSSLSDAVLRGTKSATKANAAGSTSNASAFRVRSYVWLSTVGNADVMRFFGDADSNSLIFISPSKERYTPYSGAFRVGEVHTFLDRVLTKGLRTRPFSISALRALSIAESTPIPGRGYEEENVDAISE